MQIKLPESFAITSRDTFVTINPSALSADIITKLVLHGITQKVGDAAAGALKAAGFEGQRYGDLPEADQKKVQEHSKALMVGVVESLVKGEWTERRAAETVDPLEAETRTQFGAWLRANAADVWKAKLKPLDPRDRGPALAEMFAKQDGDFKAAIVDSAKAVLAEEAKRAKKLAALSVKIKL